MVRNIKVRGAGERGMLWVKWEEKNPGQRKWREYEEEVGEDELDEFIAELNGQED